jgi:hypothetical protein
MRGAAMKGDRIGQFGHAGNSFAGRRRALRSTEANESRRITSASDLNLRSSILIGISR